MSEAMDNAALIDLLKKIDVDAASDAPGYLVTFVHRAATALASSNEMNERLVAGLKYAALKFEEIERKALHWEKTFIATEPTAARWRQIKTQAHACAAEARMLSEAK